MTLWLQRGLLFFLTSWCSLVLSAPVVIPVLAEPVVDTAAILSEQAKIYLNQQLLDIFQSGGSQIAIFTVPSLEGESIEELGIRVADKWQLGSKDRDNGVILLLSVTDRKVRIEVGQGLEGQLTDLYANRIIREQMAPLLRANDYDAALIAGIRSIAAYTDPAYKSGSETPQVKRRSPRGSQGLVSTFIFALLFLVFLFNRFGGGGGPGRSLRGGRNGWGGPGSFGGGGFSGGGFGGGGGGFSGGGSSGSW